MLDIELGDENEDLALMTTLWFVDKSAYELGKTESDSLRSNRMKLYIMHEDITE